MKNHLDKNHRIYGIIGSIVGLVVAAIYMVLLPAEAEATTGFHKLILLYGHSICWLFLSLASLLWAVNKGNKWSKRLALLGLAVYVTFMLSLLAATLTI